MSRYLKGQKNALVLGVLTFLVSLLLAATGLLINNRVALALFMGGTIATLAYFWLVWVAFRPRLGEPPGKMLMAFYMGQAGKFILTLIGYIWVFRHFSWLSNTENAVALLAGYLLAQTPIWLAPLLSTNRY